MKKGQNRKILPFQFLWVAGTTATLVAFWIASELQYARRINPVGVSTMREFVERFGEPRAVYAVSRGGTSHFEFVGKMPAPLSFALSSAPAVYVFDPEGRLVDWCGDPGDDPTHRKKWPRTDAIAWDDPSVRRLLER